MNRRVFLKNASLAAVSPGLTNRPLSTKHLILIVNGASRKAEYYERPDLSPAVHRVVRAGFVFEQDHCERIASHAVALRELLEGRVAKSGVGPSILDYVRNGVTVNSAERIPYLMRRSRPDILVWHEASPDVAHRDYDQYIRTIRRTDAAIGALFDWVKRDPYFSRTTSIVIRPEFGRDDVVNEHGSLHHSYGFYYTHRVASIFWGPDFNRGVDRTTVIRAVDMAPTLARLLGVGAIESEGRVAPGLFRS